MYRYILKTGGADTYKYIDFLNKTNTHIIQNQSKHIFDCKKDQDIRDYQVLSCETKYDADCKVPNSYTTTDDIYKCTATPKWRCSRCTFINIYENKNCLECNLEQQPTEIKQSKKYDYYFKYIQIQTNLQDDINEIFTKNMNHSGRWNDKENIPKILNYLLLDEELLEEKHLHFLTQLNDLSESDTTTTTETSNITIKPICGDGRCYLHSLAYISNRYDELPSTLLNNNGVNINLPTRESVDTTLLNSSL